MFSAFFALCCSAPLLRAGFYIFHVSLMSGLLLSVVRPLIAISFN
jgi:hypothetical protein